MIRVPETPEETPSPESVLADLVALMASAEIGLSPVDYQKLLDVAAVYMRRLESKSIDEHGELL